VYASCCSSSPGCNPDFVNEMRFHGPGEWYPQDQFVTAQNKGTVAKIFINRHISNIHEEQIGIFKRPANDDFLC
jgi:hypothetical protein